MKTDTLQECDAEVASEIARIEEIILQPLKRKRETSEGPGRKPVKPRNAASIILIDGKPGDERIVMGRRAKTLKFMPGAMVFPGGRVDRSDRSVQPVDQIHPALSQRLVTHMRGQTAEADARALTNAAIRELAEETGILVGRPSGNLPAHPDWHQFRDAGIAPAVGTLRLLSRAITPPGNPRRFDTWFFLARADEIHFTPEGGFAPSGELEELQWIRPRDAIVADTREITRVMLVELMNRLKHDPGLDPEYPAPSYFSRRDRFNRKII
ncbi:MAG: NUDIX domain-containing protein [Nitratireductor sp.]|nr:NUDIX domain-containing protein [Nitratireductor sp.]